MKALLIDVVAKTVSIIEIAKGLAPLQKAVGGLIQPLELTPAETLWLDEEGLLKNPENFFFVSFRGNMFHQALAGNGVILGNDEEGESCDTTLNPENIWVEFFTKKQLEMLEIETEPRMEMIVG
jgi:hypothetical protein